MLDIQTNIFVKSWHSVLKGTYLKGVRKQRTDFLAQKLLDKVLPDMRKKVAPVLSGFTTRPLVLTEKLQQEKFLSYNATRDVQSYIQQLNVPPDDGSVKEISVCSFSQEYTYYSNSFNEDGKVCKCSCPFMDENKVVCKHMFLVEEVLGHQIHFGTRELSGHQLNLNPLLLTDHNYSSTSGFGDAIDEVFRKAKDVQ